MICPRCGTVNADPVICERCGLDLREPTPAGPTGAGWTRDVGGIPARSLAVAALGACIVMGLVVLFGPSAGVVAIPVTGLVSRKMSHREPS